MMILKIPDQPVRDLDLLPWPGPEQRRLPLVTSGPLSQELRWRIDLPQGYGLAALPDSVALDNAAGTVSFRTAADDTMATFVSRIVLKREIVPAEQVPQLRDLLDAYRAPAHWYLLLVKKK